MKIGLLLTAEVFRTGLKESDADEGIQERDSFDYIWEQSLEKSQTSAR